MKILVIVESFTKEKTVGNYLNTIFKNTNNKFTVKASGGHICDIVKENMGIDPNSLQPVYSILNEKKTHIDNLKKLSKSHDVVYIASDNDREGEAIAWHLLNILKPKEYKRIVFNEITLSALDKAVKTPRKIDMHMVHSQQARRVLDRLVGYKITNVLWNNFTGAGMLTAGRVQSVVLKLIVEKEQNILNFNTERYWNMLGNFSNGVEDGKLCVNNTVFKFDKKEDMIQILKLLSKKNEYEIISSDTKKVQDKPDKPFTTSTLQQAAYSKGFSIKHTMSVAQELYEKGYITYMRTDSINLSEDFKKNALDHISSEFGKEYINNNLQVSQNKQKNAQEAHEAIRPTLDKNNKLNSNQNGLNDKQQKLYRIIYNRTVASLMIPAKYDELTVNIGHDNISKYKMYFRGKTKRLLHPGYLIVYQKDEDYIKKKSLNIDITKKKISATEIRGNCIWTVPPQRFNESSIIKAMETLGIGRPSTYVNIVNKLYQRNYIIAKDMFGPTKQYNDYVLKTNIIKEELIQKETYNETKKLVPSESALHVDKFLDNKFSNIINVKFTMQMENSLDSIAQNQTSYTDLIKPFNESLTKQCNSLVTKEIKKKKQVIETPTYKFNINNTDIILRRAKYGDVIQINGEKVEYIGLDPYMKLYKINDLKNVTESDIKFLLSFPKNYKDFTVHYKAYGFYVNDKKKSKSINYHKFSDPIRKSDFSFLDNFDMTTKKK